MQRIPSSSPASPAASDAQPGSDLTEAAPSSSPDLPHERDQKVGMTGGVASKQVQQAHRDVKRGLRDTSRAPEADTAYQKLKKAE